MDIIFLGTGGSVNTTRRHNTSLFFSNGSQALLVDCNGICVQRLKQQGFAFQKLEHIFLTHRHIDHIAALNNLIHQIWIKACFYANEKDKRSAPLTLYGDGDTLSKVKGLLDATDILRHPGIFPIIFHDLPLADGVMTAGEFNVSYFPVNHGATACLGLQIVTGGRSVIYSADTEPCETIYRRLKTGDVLIHECNKIDEPLSPGHTTWPQLEQIIPRLPDIDTYLVHLPEMDDEQEQKFSDFLRNRFGTRVQMARDGQTLSINPF